ncbi:MAG: hypothetical protein VB108_11630 [Anaerolineaceae bacterium]|nr:hypothetical protein [Anaerolineaceae bacterium]
MKLDFLLKIASIMPIVLFLSGALGYFGVMHLGPREVPRKNIIHKKLSLCLILIGLGMYLGLFNTSRFLSVFGWVSAVSGLILFAVLTYQVRKGFPAMSDREWIAMKKKEQSDRIEAITARRQAKKQGAK